MNEIHPQGCVHRAVQVSGTASAIRGECLERQGAGQKLKNNWHAGAAAACASTLVERAPRLFCCYFSLLDAVFGTPEALGWQAAAVPA